VLLVHNTAHVRYLGELSVTVKCSTAVGFTALCIAASLTVALCVYFYRTHCAQLQRELRESLLSRPNKTNDNYFGLQEQIMVSIDCSSMHS
jgi:hypothetical protein